MLYSVPENNYNQTTFKQPMQHNLLPMKSYWTLKGWCSLGYLRH